jgi:hypothetical protein
MLTGCFIIFYTIQKRLCRSLQRTNAKRKLLKRVKVQIVQKLEASK